ncbi:hypothetical protein [Corallococcus sp. bb12-1]|uniref:hypothetical protein n=1 Tax=Corallococcus sp. bb12-1 TaxID=2996784 RepID=UPI002D1E44D7|nr:hypothetical protein [Corallococcus sp. bb12-1]
MDSDDSNAPSRRQIVGGLATGIAAVFGTSAVAAPDGGTRAVAAPVPLQNPVTLHPKPPFASQTQPWPGLAGKMQPRPDHGEKSYKGSGRLAGRKALITGGDSGIGRAAAMVFPQPGVKRAGGS